MPVSSYEREHIESLLRLTSPPASLERGIGLYLMPATVESRLVYDLAVAPALWENGVNVVGTLGAFDSDSDLRDVARWIGTAEIVLADVSPGAIDLMYTLGVCHGLGRCPLLLVRSPGRLPFNLRMLRHFNYEDSPEGLAALREQLTRGVRVFLTASRAGRDMP
jgi:hypothetical protein